ncbi:MAG: MBL fold metallo-hydrolase [Dehalococcoidia bacterium]|nr:MBL fold metallo-hydrolase [Dehalococcoidia bacterium]
MQATESVHVLRVNVKPYTGAYSPNVFAVVDSGQAVLIDAGFPNDDSVDSRLDYLKTIGGPRVEMIIVTHHHFDHAGGANRLREATGARIAMHPEEARLLQQTPARPPRDGGPQEQYMRQEVAKITVDQPLADGDVMRVGRLALRILHTPGPSAGHVCVFLEEERVLFSGDNVLGLGTTAIPPPPDGDMARYIESLERMKALDAALICPGHGPLVHQPERKIQELIDHRHEREEQVLALLREGKRTPTDMMRAIYPELDPRLERMAVGQVLSHLYKLRDEGRVTLRREGEGVVCEPRDS